MTTDDSKTKPAETDVGQAPTLTTAVSTPDKPGEPPDEPLREKLAHAQESLRKAESDLAKFQEEAKLQEEIPKIISDYDAEYPDLQRDQVALKDYAEYEKGRLKQHLTDDQIKKIYNAESDACRELNELKQRIEETNASLARWNKRLIDRKKKAEKAKAALDAIKKPVSSIRDRLKRADARKIEVEKAYDAGNYAKAYWLLTSEMKLAGLVDAEIQVLDLDDLRKAVGERGTEYANAVADVAAAEARIKTKEAWLKEDQVRLAERTKSLDERIIRTLSTVKTTEPAAPQPAG